MGTVTIISHRKTLAHISVLFMNSVTKGADDLSCKFYHRLHLHAQHTSNMSRGNRAWSWRRASTVVKN